MEDRGGTSEQGRQNQARAVRCEARRGRATSAFSLSHDQTRPRAVLLPVCASQKKLLAPGHSGDQHTSDGVEPEEPEEPEPPEELEPPGAASQQQPGPVLSPQGKLVIMVEDFYYGSTPQAPPAPQSAPPRPARPYSCIHCPRTLSSNIR